MPDDELRALLARYPDLDARDRRRLRKLYQEASATEIMAILLHPDLGPKARRVERPSDFTWDVWLALTAAAAALLIALYLLMQS
ncbi:hypothetical protein ACFOMD_10980 [Sphingoaurantiacus capsulatus]|uniref:Uncharacterized protein n=1 Tax=Sphingoaurantiacus capsulatus TaxID=1771310 RepID=A0ABV7XEK7_9SPHN